MQLIQEIIDGKYDPRTPLMSIEEDAEAHAKAAIETEKRAEEIFAAIPVSTCLSFQQAGHLWKVAQILQMTSSATLELDRFNETFDEQRRRVLSWRVYAAGVVTRYTAMFDLLAGHHSRLKAVSDDVRAGKYHDEGDLSIKGVVVTLKTLGADILRAVGFDDTPLGYEAYVSASAYAAQRLLLECSGVRDLRQRNITLQLFMVEELSEYITAGISVGSTTARA